MCKKQQKSKAIALTFHPFLADFSFFEKEVKNSCGKRGSILLRSPTRSQNKIHKRIGK
jgi:hypothetical protein